MSVKLSDIVVSFTLPTWNLQPGRVMWEQYIAVDRSRGTFKTYGKLNESVEKVFKKFINEKIPLVKTLMGQLIQNRNISEVHLPLSLNAIFSGFIDELVEHYQNQLEKRDPEIDQKLLDIKRLLAKNLDLPWANNVGAIKRLFDELRKKLVIEEALPPNFDHSISVWLQILIIPNMGNFVLAALYEKAAVVDRLCLDKPVREDGCFTPLSRHVLEQAFTFLLRQVSKNSAWVFQEMHDKIPVVDDQSLELDLRRLIADKAHHKQFEQPSSVLFQQFEKEMKDIIEELISLNIDEFQSLKDLDNLNKHFMETNHMMFTQRSDLEWKSDDVKYGIDNVAVKLDPRHVSHLNNYFLASNLKRIYLTSGITDLLLLLKPLIHSKLTWNLCVNSNYEPVVLAQAPPLLPAVNSCDRIAMDEWETSLETKSKEGRTRPTGSSRKTKRKNENQKRQTNTAIISPVSAKKSKDVLATVSSTSALSNLSPVELLRNKLTQLYHGNRSPALRQAIWHLDSLISIQKSVVKSQKKAPDCLTIANSVTHCAQKVLEQTYRFCLKEEGEPLNRIHNLKTYHRKFDPKYKSYPTVVKDLFLANNWCRYFYSEHKKWHSLTTGIATTPPVLDSLFQMAEGRNLSAEELEKIVSSTIESVRQHVEFLIQEQKVPNLQVVEFQNKAVKLKEPFSLNVFDAVTKKLGELLVSSKLNTHHPVHLRIKQVFAALKMQKASLEKMNTSQDMDTFSTWTVWNLQQLQESIEGVLHAVEYFQDHEISTDHELKDLAKKAKLDMGVLGDDYQKLSYKTRYPAEVLSSSLPSQIIDDLEALKKYPEIIDGFKFKEKPPLLWANPSEEASLDAIAVKLNKLMSESEEFLRVQAIPALERLLSSL
jgi:hypothetical protein